MGSIALWWSWQNIFWGDDVKKVAIDLTWVRHNKVGGTESCVRNLLNGFLNLNQSDILFVLLVSKDNADSFKVYDQLNIFDIALCDTVSESQLRRVVWQNTKMRKLLRSLKVEVCLEPIYSLPFLRKRGVKYIVTIHDLQAIHYPEYFSKARNLWMRLSWWYAVHFSEKVVAISHYVKDDILRHFKVKNKKIEVIYDAIDIDISKKDEQTREQLLQKYNLIEKNFYYTVSALLPHKNLTTLIKAMAILKKSGSDSFKKLVVSGIGGKARSELEELIYSNNLIKDIIFTDYISDIERNIFYKSCKVFLFPSVFEGFGMPPIEAMAFGTPVLTTDKTSIPEVTQGLCRYIHNPLSPNEWAKEIVYLCGLPCCVPWKKREKVLKMYSPDTIAKEYIDLIKNMD